MTNTTRTARAIFVLLACVAGLAGAQQPDTTVRDTTAEHLGLWTRSSRASGLVLSSAKTYNRVEGLPVYLGPILRDSSGRAAFNVDEAVTVTEDELGVRALGDLVRRGRHFGLEVHVLTQRVTDWFDSRIG